MYSLLLVLLTSITALISPISFASVSSGDKISAKIFNESTSHIGEIKQALLTQEQFQSLYGECWVKMQGQSIAGSDYALLTGIATLPNADGRFLRNTGGNSLALGQVQEDAFQGHRHSLKSKTSGADSYQGSMQHAGTYNETDTQAILDPISDGVNGTPRTANETRPVNLVVNMFIKINHECN